MSDEQKSMSVEELEAVRAREKAATPGPWEVSRLSHGERNGTEEVCDLVNDTWVVTRAGFLEDFRRDAAFIAHARQDVPRMLATIDKLREDAAAEEWQSIEMAPEDEGLVQVWDSFENLPVVARFDGMHWISEETGRELAPTHYRRMPKSPFAATGAGQ